jgi:hypothetical protein
MDRILMFVISSPAAKPAGAYIPALLVPLGVILFTIYYLNSTRGNPLPEATPLAEEVHASPLWGTVLAVASVGPVLAAMQSPLLPIRVGIAAICGLLLVSALAAWSGFHYSFTQYGLEISTLGYRLRSIPKEQIERFAIQPWSILRGYGIRGIGNLRAYVWGNKGVQIDTGQGQVYLGHDDPEQIVRDLNMITQSSRGQIH